MTNMNKKQISFSEFTKIALELKKHNVFDLTFLGGEPTLHSDFVKIVNFTLRHFMRIKIYTNGIFPKPVLNILSQFGSRFQVFVNIATPGFQFNSQTRETVLNNINELKTKTSVYLSIVNLYMNTNAIDNFQHIPKAIMSKVGVRFNFATYAAGDKNPITINDFPKVGANLCQVIQALEQKGPPQDYVFDHNFRPCMFSNKDKKFLKTRGLDYVTQNTACHESQYQDCTKNQGHFHITSDLTTFRCYQLSTINQFKLDLNNLNELTKRYDQIDLEYAQKYVLPKCRTCPMFGYNQNQCSGPCMGFRLNALRPKELKIFKES